METKLDTSQITGTYYASAEKTTSQTTVTTGATTLITWQAKEEYRDTSMFSTATSAATMPANGWLKVSVTLSIIGGQQTDDSMLWGVYVDGAPKRLVNDNWHAQSASGIEFVTSMTTGFKVTAGQAVTVQYYETQTAVSIMGIRSYVTLEFVPE